MPEIVLLTERVEHETLVRLVRDGFGDMLKFVADVERGVVAAGGDLHADAEEFLLGQGSFQKNLWGANYYPARPREECVEFTSLINIRPSQGNPGMEIADPSVRSRVRDLAFRLIGDGGAL